MPHRSFIQTTLFAALLTGIVYVEPLAERPWGMKDFAVADPTGVLWRIAQNSPRTNA